jgi:hypothetical protein
MGAQKKEFEKTIPVFEKQKFQKDLDLFVMLKEKSGRVISSSTVCKSKLDSIQPQSSKI